jgi:drug/metabolite transporter (DMT)-like permease
MLSIVWAVVFIVVGLLCMLSGARHYKAVVISLAFLVGMFAGYCLGERIDAPYIVAACLGVLLAVAAYPLMKYAVAAFGALTGAFVGANLWVGLAHAMNKGGGTAMPAEAYWIGALIGLIVCGMLAFILFKFSVMMFTSVSGATVAVLGVLCLLLSFQPWQSNIVSGLTASQLVVPLLVFVPAVIALILQQTWTPELAGAGLGGKDEKK